ncbi:MAG: hypothetical protein CBC34_000610 [Hyphomicrobiaceae bacterium TMED74]|nr:MAG: hypothetical protein CBC34_000610 [Hyphomicrobiaceae bacterium TMED74]
MRQYHAVGATKFPRTVVRDLLDLRLPLELVGSRREVAVLFTDIDSFTTLTEFEPPETLVDGLANYFDIIVDTIHAQVNTDLGLRTWVSHTCEFRATAGSGRIGPVNALVGARLRPLLPVSASERTIPSS